MLKDITIFGKKGKRGKRRPVWTGTPAQESAACWRYGWGLISSDISGIEWSVDLNFTDGNVISISLQEYYDIMKKKQEKANA